VGGGVAGDCVGAGWVRGSVGQKRPPISRSNRCPNREGRVQPEFVIAAQRRVSRIAAADRQVAGVRPLERISLVAEAGNYQRERLAIALNSAHT
jgi:hypothetical protein